MTKVAPGQPIRISGVVNTLNAAATLRGALESLFRWVDEIVVVDMHSDDDTVEIARSFGAVVHLHERTGYVEPARGFAVERARGEWVMILDADEMVPPSLADRLLAIVAHDEADVVDIPWGNHLFGQRARHGYFAAERDRHRRFFRRGALTLGGAVHHVWQPTAEARVLRLPPTDDFAVQHFSHLDVADFVQKMNRYTTIEADSGSVLLGSHPKDGPIRAGLRQTWRSYIRDRGYRDGWRGYHASLLLGIYRAVSRMKAHELASGAGRGAVERDYQAFTDQIVKEWQAWVPRD